MSLHRGPWEDYSLQACHAGLEASVLYESGVHRLGEFPPLRVCGIPIAGSLALKRDGLGAVQTDGWS